MNGVDLWRSNPERVADARRILDDPTTQHMIAIMITENILPLVPAGAPDISSVRVYHEAFGRQDAITTFQTLGIPLATQPEAEEPTYDPPPETTTP